MAFKGRGAKRRALAFKGRGAKRRALAFKGRRAKRRALAFKGWVTHNAMFYILTATCRITAETLLEKRNPSGSELLQSLLLHCFDGLFFVAVLDGLFFVAFMAFFIVFMGCFAFFIVAFFSAFFIVVVSFFVSSTQTSTTLPCSMSTIKRPHDQPFPGNKGQFFSYFVAMARQRQCKARQCKGGQA
jgi:hypothetical protein